MRELVCGIILLVGLASTEEPTLNQKQNVTKDENSINKRFILSIPEFNSLLQNNNQVLPVQQLFLENPQYYANYINDIQLRTAPFGSTQNYYLLPRNNYIQTYPGVAQAQNIIQTQQVVPQQVIPQQAILQRVLPQQVTTQQVATQQVIPQQAVPQQEVPQQVVPQQVLPQQIIPQQVASQQAAPQQVFQQQIVPQEVLPQQEVPQQIVSQQIAPQQLLRQQVVPQQIVSQQVVPQQLLRHQVVPLQLLRQQVVPQQIVPQQLVPQQILRQQAIPQQLLRHQVVPHQLLRQQVVPQQIVPQQVVPQQILRQQAVPQLFSRQQVVQQQVVHQPAVPQTQGNIYGPVAQQQITPLRIPLQYQSYQLQQSRPQVQLGVEPYPYQVPPGQNKLPVVSPKQTAYVPQAVPQVYPFHQRNLIYNIPAYGTTPLFQQGQIFSRPETGYSNPNLAYQPVVRIGYGHPHFGHSGVVHNTQPHTVYVNPRLQTGGTQQVVRIGYGYPHLDQGVQEQSIKDSQRAEGVQQSGYQYGGGERSTRAPASPASDPAKGEVKPKKAEVAKT